MIWNYILNGWSAYWRAWTQNEQYQGKLAKLLAFKEKEKIKKNFGTSLKKKKRMWHMGKIRLSALFDNSALMLGLELE